jgi:uncharacterized protein (TIGR02145 family)
MRKSFLIFIAMTISAFCFSQTVTIGKQVWSTQNLELTRFRNGDLIPQAKTNEDWHRAYINKQPAWCYVNNDSTTNGRYGKLYNWYAVNDPRGLAPAGWHIPTDAEWTALVNALDGESEAGYALKAKSGWYENGNGSKSNGFSAMPGGFRHNEGAFFHVEQLGFWWSATAHEDTLAWYRTLYHDSPYMTRFDGLHGDGLSVRCLKD